MPSIAGNRDFRSKIVQLLPLPTGVGARRIIQRVEKCLSSVHHCIVGDRDIRSIKRLDDHFHHLSVRFSSPLLAAVTQSGDLQSAQTMDGKECPKTRRPLPNPKPAPAQRPNTPVLTGALNTAVSPDNFYGKPTHTPVKTRSNTVGSSHTTYIPPEDPPAYGSPGFREPELIADEPIPALTPSAAGNWKELDLADSSWPTADWEVGYAESAATWGPVAGYNSAGYTNLPKSLVDIDGRDESEEKIWWDPQAATRSQRPGPGMLPTVLAEHLHNPDHSLFSVSIKHPETRSTLQAPNSVASMDENAPLSTPTRSWSAPPTQSPAPTTPATHVAHSPPTEDDVRTAVPHPNAYYCPKEHGWVILSWKSSSAALPLAESFDRGDHKPLPSQSRRRATNTCLNNDTPNKTHHFHKYERAVDSHKLTHPFRLEEWEAMESVKQKRRAAPVTLDIDINQMNPSDIELLADEEKEEGEGKLLDLYVCCQCSFYCVASGVLPGVFSRKTFGEFVKDKRANPLVGKTGEQGINLSIETFLVSV